MHVCIGTPHQISYAFCTTDKWYAPISLVQIELKGGLARIGVTMKGNTISRDDVIAIPASIMDELCKRWIAARTEDQKGDPCTA